MSVTKSIPTSSVMHVLYSSIYDILRPRTNQIADLRLCEGLAENGCPVELIVPFLHREDNIRKESVDRVYEIHVPFGKTYVWTPFRDGTSYWLILPLLNISLLIRTARSCLRSLLRGHRHIIVSRNVDLLILPALMTRLMPRRIRPKIIIWAHEVVSRRRHVWMYRYCSGVVATNSQIADDLCCHHQVPPEKVAVSLNPISSAQIRSVISRRVAREMLRLEAKRPLVVYTGKLYVGQQEAEYYLEAARQLPDYDFILTGGKPPVVEHFQRTCHSRRIHNVTFTGYLHDYSKIRLYQFAADLLVSYYSEKDHQVRHNLPNKLCEYMLTSNPIVCSDHPAVRDVLTEANALLVEPENPVKLAEAIQFTVENPLSEKLAAQAFLDVQSMTYKKKARDLLDFFQEL